MFSFKVYITLLSCNFLFFFFLIITCALYMSRFINNKTIKISSWLQKALTNFFKKQSVNTQEQFSFTNNTVLILSGSNSTFKIVYLIKIRKHTYLTCSIHIDIGVVCQGKCPSCFSIKIFAEFRNCNLAIARVFFILMFIHVHIKKLIMF